MRLDKYLKVSRIIKRRTVANEACSGGRVFLNERIAKPSSDVKPGDIIAIRFGEHVGRYRVCQVKEVVRKEETSNLYELISEDEQVHLERNS